MSAGAARGSARLHSASDAPSCCYCCLSADHSAHVLAAEAPPTDKQERKQASHFSHCLQRPASAPASALTVGVVFHRVGPRGEVLENLERHAREEARRLGGVGGEQRARQVFGGEAREDGVVARRNDGQRLKAEAGAVHGEVVAAVVGLQRQLEEQLRGVVVGVAGAEVLRAAGDEDAVDGLEPGGGGGGGGQGRRWGGGVVRPSGCSRERAGAGGNGGACAGKAPPAPAPAPPRPPPPSPVSDLRGRHVVQDGHHPRPCALQKLDVRGGDVGVALGGRVPALQCQQVLSGGGGDMGLLLSGAPPHAAPGSARRI